MLLQSAQQSGLGLVAALVLALVLLLAELELAQQSGLALVAALVLALALALAQ